MSLTVRHRWCVEKILHCFGDSKENDSKLQVFMRRTDVIAKFNNLFSGEGENVIFVHYQPVSLKVSKF